MLIFYLSLFYQRMLHAFEDSNTYMYIYQHIHRNAYVHKIYVAYKFINFMLKNLRRRNIEKVIFIYIVKN